MPLLDDPDLIVLHAPAAVALLEERVVLKARISDESLAEPESSRDLYRRISPHVSAR